jgi:hypothetical protein
MAIYEIIVVLITLMLSLTLKLKTVESITTADGVVRGRKSTTTVKKIDKIELKENVSVEKRKEIKVPDKREIPQEINEVQEIKKVKSVETPKETIIAVNVNKPDVNKQVKPVSDTHEQPVQHKLYPTTKKYK